MDLIPSAIASDLSIVRRVIFSAVYLPREFPDYWSTIARFASNESVTVTPADVKLMVENIQAFNQSAFLTDKQLAEEIHVLGNKDKYSLGIVLISNVSTCPSCNGKLLTKIDRPSHLIIYTETYGTVVGTHYHKYCQNFRKGCNYSQFYGYHSNGSQSPASYDSNWAQLKYFVSTSETAFEMSMLAKYDSELLVGQLSYEQKADIYNYINNYPVSPKQCSTIKKDDT